MAKIKNQFETTRTMYNAAKKYDRQQFDSFCEDIYQKGAKAGRKEAQAEAEKNAAPAFNKELFFEKLAELKGIGSAKLEAIKEAYKQTEEESNGKETGAGA